MTFDEWKESPSLDSDTFGEKYLRSIGISYVAIKTAKNDWYQNGVTAAMQAASRVTIGKNAIGYGSSMGAYAAINFSAKLGLRRCVCFSPQYSIDRYRVPFEQRWAQEASHSLFRDDLIEQGSKAICHIFFDPYHSDGKHVELISKYCDVRPIRIPFGGHEIPRLLLHAGILSDVIFRLFQDIDPDLANVYRSVRRSKRDLSEYWVEMSQRYFRKGNREKALDAARTAIERLGGDQFGVNAHLANMYLQSKKPVQAIGIYQRYLSNAEHRDIVKGWLRNCFIAAEWTNLADEFKK